MTRQEAIEIAVKGMLQTVERSLTAYLEQQDPKVYNLLIDVSNIDYARETGILGALIDGFCDEPALTEEDRSLDAQAWDTLSPTSS